MRTPVKRPQNDDFCSVAEETIWKSIVQAKLEAMDETPPTRWISGSR